MARKNLLDRVTTPFASAEEAQQSRTSYALRGASRSLMLSIDEIAENAKRFTAGETIVEIDPNIIDPSSIQDRINDAGDEQEFTLFLESIREQGQQQPILIRPHPHPSERYIIVFGRRRLRAARELHRPVRAIIKTMDEATHVITQGQENTQRKDYSFIEKALFAQQILKLGHPREVAKHALSVDDSLLSRMLSTTEIIPPEIIAAIGAARTVGRDRWEELKKLFSFPNAVNRAHDVIKMESFVAADSSTRFNTLLQHLKSNRPRERKSRSEPDTWTSRDTRVAATFRNCGKTFKLSLTEPNQPGFGKFLSSNLERLYHEYRTKSPTGEE